MPIGKTDVYLSGDWWRRLSRYQVPREKTSFRFSGASGRDSVRIKGGLLKKLVPRLSGDDKLSRRELEYSTSVLSGQEVLLGMGQGRDRDITAMSIGLEWKCYNVCFNATSVLSLCKMKNTI